MEDIQNIIVVGDGCDAKYNTSIQPVRFNKPMSMAITSIYHGPLSNIHDENNKIYFRRVREQQTRDIIGYGDLDIHEFARESVETSGDIEFSIESIADQTAGDDKVNDEVEFSIESIADQTAVDDKVIIDDAGEEYQRNAVYYIQREIKVGYYKSSLDILRSIQSVISTYYDENQSGISTYYNENDAELRLNTTKLGRSKIGVSSINIQIENRKDSPWSMLGVNQTHINPGDNITDIENKRFESANKVAFLYVNIVENSYINGNLSRILSVVPIQKTSGWIYHQFNHLNYVPIAINEFSNILLELRDLNGNYLHFDTDFKTVITLKIRPINMR